MACLIQARPIFDRGKKHQLNHCHTNRHDKPKIWEVIKHQYKQYLVWKWSRMIKTSLCSELDTCCRSTWLMHIMCRIQKSRQAEMWRINSPFVYSCAAPSFTTDSQFSLPTHTNTLKTHRETLTLLYLKQWGQSYYCHSKILLDM